MNTNGINNSDLSVSIIEKQTELVTLDHNDTPGMRDAYGDD
jgi:hypothetical protein